MNYTCVFGKVTRDPETLATKKDNVTKFGVAVSQKFGNVERKMFYNVEFWGKRGDTIKEWFKKGDSIWVTGSQWQNDYVDKQGVKKINYVFEGKDWGFVGKMTKPDAAAKDEQFDGPPDEPSDDIPF